MFAEIVRTARRRCSKASGRFALFGLMAVVTLLCATSPAHAQPAFDAPVDEYGRSLHGGFDAAAEAQLVELINQSRAAHGLSALAVDSGLTQAARQHSQAMAQRSAISHQFPGEEPPEMRMANQEVKSDAEGENVDLDQSVRGAHEALMHSPPHRENILDRRYNAVGIGVVRRGANIYVTEDFARRMVQYSEPQAETAAQSAIVQYAVARGMQAPVRRGQPGLRRMACDMALDDELNLQPASRIAGVQSAYAWTTGDPGRLPKDIGRVLSSGLQRGYALGACFAPSISHPAGIYWLLMVSY